MDVTRRIRLCILLEKMGEHKVYSRKLGLRNETRFHGQKVTKENVIC